MAQSATTPVDLIIEAIAHHPGCGLDELVAACPALSWNQIFLEVDQLSRAGRLRLMLLGRGRYRLAIVTEGGSCVPESPDPPTNLSVPTQSRYEATCERCGGLMVSEEFDDFNGWRCILCGERVDPVILAQRRKSELACLRTVHAAR